MASLYKTEGHWVVDIYRMGRVRFGKNKADAALAYRHISRLESNKKYGIPHDPEVLDWIRNLSERVRNRLQAIGLISLECPTVGELIKHTSKATGKPSTKTNRAHAAGMLTRYFGDEHPVIDIRPADAKAMQEWMLNEGRLVSDGDDPQGLATATVSRRLKHIRSIFAVAVDQGWIRRNPFQKIKAGKQCNESRSVFVCPELSRKLIDEMPSVELRLIVALARWAGMRVPSEPLELRWDGVDFDKGSLRFLSIKTQHLPGRSYRKCPIFPELRPYLWDAWKHRSGPWVCPRLRDYNHPGISLRKLTIAALKRLHVDPWEKLFSNMRATRATEIDDEYGAKAESEWIGHGASIALKHYLIVSDAKWDKATGKLSDAPPENAKQRT